MATTKISFDQLVETAKQLPESQQWQLVDAMGVIPTGERARQLLESLGEEFRLPAARQKRLSKLLAKGNAGTLTTREQRELQALVDEYELRRLELGRAVAMGSRNQRNKRGSAATVPSTIAPADETR